MGHFIIATDREELYTVTRGVAGFTSGGLGSGTQYPIKMMYALLMTIPTALVFIIFQRFFTQAPTPARTRAEKPPDVRT